MYCHNCGKEIDDKAVVCIHCGVAVGEKNGAEAVAENRAPEKQESRNTVAMVGFVLSLVSAFFCVIMLFSAVAVWILSLLLGVAGIACSAVGMKAAKRNNGKYRGLAIAGLAVSIVSVSIIILLFILGLTILSALL